ncbi:MAG: UDP-3-O-acyl-N-acetylglucosamine deacetylase [Rhodobacteraceae bacterium]|nr:UDP-3-O-acyl-N-acetylglucosamine deacetylase [Paracoccaceae bacterium]
MQTTIAESFRLADLALHSGQESSVTFFPAPVNTGIIFRRTDVLDADAIIPARVEYVSDVTLCTKVTNADGVSVSTIEHALAGLAACGVRNAVLEVSGPELPALDGSALPYVIKILEVGVKPLDMPVKVIRILKPVSVEFDGVRASLEPSEQAEMDFTINFPEPIGNQNRSMILANGSIARHLSDSRTFCIRSQIESLLSNGFGLGGNNENVLVADCENNRFLGEPRHKDECVRHKMLDAVGDLSLAGSPIIGKFRGYRSGHQTTVALLRQLFAEEGAFELSDADSDTAARLPGAGVHIRDVPPAH